MADSEGTLQQLVTEFDRVCKRRKLKVNVDKSKVLRCSREDPVPRIQIQLGGEQLEQVDSFKYLGSNAVACTFVGLPSPRIPKSCIVEVQGKANHARRGTAIT